MTQRPSSNGACGGSWRPWTPTQALHLTPAACRFSPTTGHPSGRCQVRGVVCRRRRVVDKHDQTLLLFREVLARLALPPDDQIRTKEPGVCLACDLVNDYEDANFTWVAMGLSGDLE